MQCRISPRYRIGASARRLACRFPLLLAGAAASCTALTAVLAISQSAVPPGGALRTDKVNLPNAINQPPDANARMEMREQTGAGQSFAAMNAVRRKQISDDSARLLKLAAELKAEVDKSTKDTLSLNVIRKADEIERLAHGVKEKMKLTAAGN